MRAGGALNTLKCLLCFLKNCVCAQGWDKKNEQKRNPDPFRGIVAPTLQLQALQMSEPFDLVIMVWPQRGEGAQYKSWDLSLQFIFSCPSEGRCNSCPCNLLYWAAANWSAQGWKVQLTGRGVQYALAGKFQFIRILREWFGGDLGAYFYGAHFSMNGFKNNFIVSIVYTGLCREMFQAAVNFLKLEGDVICLRCWGSWEHDCDGAPTCTAYRCQILFPSLTPERHLLLWWNRTSLQYLILKTCFSDEICFSRFPS